MSLAFYLTHPEMVERARHLRLRPRLPQRRGPRGMERARPRARREPRGARARRARRPQPRGARGAGAPPSAQGSRTPRGACWRRRIRASSTAWRRFAFRLYHRGRSGRAVPGALSSTWRRRFRARGSRPSPGPATRRISMSPRPSTGSCWTSSTRSRPRGALRPTVTASGQPEDALADDVALDLARSGRDRVLPRRQHAVEPPRRVRHRRRRPDSPGRASPGARRRRRRSVRRAPSR